MPISDSHSLRCLPGAAQTDEQHGKAIALRHTSRDRGMAYHLISTPLLLVHATAPLLSPILFRSA